MVKRIGPAILIGWREWVGLPDLGVPWVKAKIDTGARSSALHAFQPRVFVRDGAEWVRFSVHPWQRSAANSTTVELPLMDRRGVRSSSGSVEERLVVSTVISLAQRLVTAELTLTNRDDMGFRMLIGREALRQGYLVDSDVSYACGRPSSAVRRKNRTTDA